MNWKQKIKNFALKPKILDGVKWLYIDLYRYKKYPHLYKKRFDDHGVFIVTGSTGGGKTSFVVHSVLETIEKLGRENLIIASNTDFAFQDFKVEHWGDLTLYYNKPFIFIYDECNSDWTQNSYKELDLKLREALTQNRKGQSKQIFAITQDYGMLLNEWRRLSKKVYTCKTLFNRYTVVKRYHAEDYEHFYNITDLKEKMKIRKEKRISFVQTDDFRKNYNSYGLVKSIKKPYKEYKLRKELIKYIDTSLTDIDSYIIE